MNSNHKAGLRTWSSADDDYAIEHVFECSCGERVASTNLLVALGYAAQHEAEAEADNEAFGLEGR